MGMREKLIEMLDDIQLRGEDFTDYEIYGMRLPNTVSNEDVADHLIANDVIPVVRCKDCKHCRTASWGEKFCVRKQIDGVYAELSNLSDDDFCSYGVRKDMDGDVNG